jgi:YD repeat-containing protein
LRISNNSSNQIITKVQPPATAPQEFCYNTDGLMTTSANSDNEDQDYTYDNSGKLVKSTDSLNNITDTFIPR